MRLLLGALLLIGVSTAPGAISAADAPRPLLIPPARFENYPWNIVSYFDGHALINMRPGASILFKDGHIQGRGDCGAFSGSYFLSGATLRIRAETVLADGPCFQANLDESQAILAALNDGERRIEQSPGRVVLRDTRGTIQIVLTPAQ